MCEGLLVLVAWNKTNWKCVWWVLIDLATCNYKKWWIIYNYDRLDELPDSVRPNNFSIKFSNLVWLNNFPTELKNTFQAK